MLYRNKRTGAVIETECAVSGGDWEPAKRPEPVKTEKPAAVPKKAARRRRRRISRRRRAACLRWRSVGAGRGGCSGGGVGRAQSPCQVYSVSGRGLRGSCGAGIGVPSFVYR